MAPMRLPRLALLATLAAACVSPVETTLPPPPPPPLIGGSPGLGSVMGTIRGSGTGYPVNGNGSPVEDIGQWPVLSIIATAPAQSPRFAARIGQGTFEFTGLAAGEWRLAFNGMHPWTYVFPNMRLYADTVINVTVLPNQTVILPEMVLRPVAPFVVIATEVCPWGFSGPPTLQDWGNCDSGYWGGVDAAVEVRGIAGTPTAGARYSLSIPRDRWHVELHDVPAGEYDVDVVPVNSWWRLLPWQSSPVRLRVERGLAYAEFDYWYEK